MKQTLFYLGTFGKNFPVAIALIILVFCLSGCGNPAQKGNTNKENDLSVQKKGKGTIVFDKEIHNFGTLKDGEMVSFSFVFRNTGDAAVTIKEIEKSCGCLDVHYNENKVLPGDSSLVEIIFNTSGEWGNQLKEITLTTDQGERKTLQIGAYIDNEKFNNLLNTQK